MVEPWRSLRVGDQIRIVRMPSEIDKPGHVLPLETMRLYERLIGRGRSVRVCEIDGHGLPRIECRFKLADGT